MTNIEVAQYMFASQWICGCSRGQPCYWSSQGSDCADSNEWISFGTNYNLFLVKKIDILPYCAFWQPDTPTYAPLKVQLRFIKRDFNDGAPYFISELFVLENAFRRQQFELQQPALFLGGEVLLFFHGKQQRQTLGVGLDHYYVCIAEISIFGNSFDDFELVTHSLPISKQGTDVYDDGIIKTTCQLSNENPAFQMNPEESILKLANVYIGQILEKSTFYVQLARRSGRGEDVSIQFF